MTDRYIRSADGSDADNGSTWGLAKATLAGVDAIDTAGDRLFVADGHSESTAADVTLAFAGTVAAPTRLLCVNDTADPEPPTALATGASVATTGASKITVTGNVVGHGITFSVGTGALNYNGQWNQTSYQKQQWTDCEFIMAGTNGGNRLLFGQSAWSNTELVNPKFKFGSTAQKVNCRGRVRINGGSFLAGGSSPANGVFETDSAACSVLVDGFDFSGAAAAVNLAAGGGLSSAKIVIRNSKLPASWSGGVVHTALTAPTGRVEMWNCDSADTNYRMWIETFSGSIRDETTLVKTGGASDGDTPLSWKFASNANAQFPLFPIVSPEIFSERITTVGSAKTITVDILHDSLTNLQDDEIWLEVQYLGTSGVPLSLFAHDAVADVLATAADQTASSATWTTTGMTNPNKQKLSVTFTPQEKGVVICRVKCAKPSYTVYVDPVAQVS